MRGAAGNALRRPLAGPGLGDHVTVRSQRGAHRPPDLRLVVNDQNICRGQRSSLPPRSTGSVNENTEPWPSWLVTLIVPCCATISALAIGNPMPVPRTRYR